MTNYKLSWLGALALAGTLAIPAAYAQSVIRINNVTPVRDIPLEAGSTVQFDASGNLIANCALTAGACAALGGTGGATPAPTATLTRADTAPEINPNGSVRLAWTSTGASVCNAASSGPSSTSFTGPRATSNSPTGETVTLSQEGTYNFTLSCFNDGGTSGVKTVSVTVVPGTSTGTNACTASGPLIQPPSLTRVDKTWSEAFKYPNGTQVPTYPTGLPTGIPVGAEKGSYTVIPFVPTAGLTVNMFWDPAQAQNSIGYSNPRPATAMFVAISPCPGDLRPINGSSSDPFEHTTCRRFANTASIFYTTNPSGNVCRLTAGIQYYITVAAIDTSDGLQAGEDSCGNSSLTGCDVQMRHDTQ